MLGDADGPGRLLWVEGEAGIGKTRLLAEGAAIARDLGRQVLRAGGWSDPSTPAYSLWTQVLRQALTLNEQASGLELVRSRWGRRASPAVALLPALADGVLPGQTERAADRLQLFDAVHAVLQAEARDHPLLLILDDLHWADPDSLQLLTFLAGTGGRTAWSCSPPGGHASNVRRTRRTKLA